MDLKLYLLSFFGKIKCYVIDLSTVNNPSRTNNNYLAENCTGGVMSSEVRFRYIM